MLGDTFMEQAPYCGLPQLHLCGARAGGGDAGGSGVRGRAGVLVLSGRRKSLEVFKWEDSGRCFVSILASSSTRLGIAGAFVVMPKGLGNPASH